MFIIYQTYILVSISFSLHLVSFKEIIPERVSGGRFSLRWKPERGRFRETGPKLLRNLFKRHFSPPWPAPAIQMYLEKCCMRHSVATWRRSVMSSWKILFHWQLRPQHLQQQGRQPQQISTEALARSTTQVNLWLQCSYSHYSNVVW